MEDLSRNLHLYKRMKDLAVQQEACLSEDRMELFFQLANQREQLRLQITANEKKKAPPLNPPPPDRRETTATSLRADITDVIRSIQEIDRKIEEIVFRQRESILSDLASLRTGRKAVRGYGSRAGSGDPRFIDRKS